LVFEIHQVSSRAEAVVAAIKKKLIWCYICSVLYPWFGIYKGLKRWTVSTFFVYIWKKPYPISKTLGIVMN